jgi:hypothetical protein
VSFGIAGLAYWRSGTGARSGSAAFRPRSRAQMPPGRGAELASEQCVRYDAAEVEWRPIAAPDVRLIELPQPGPVLAARCAAPDFLQLAPVEAGIGLEIFVYAFQDARSIVSRCAGQSLPVGHSAFSIAPTASFAISLASAPSGRAAQGRYCTMSSDSRPAAAALSRTIAPLTRRPAGSRPIPPPASGSFQSCKGWTGFRLSCRHRTGAEFRWTAARRRRGVFRTGCQTPNTGWRTGDRRAPQPSR